MSGKQKILLVVLAVLLVVLFVVAVAGRDAGRGDASGDYPFVKWLSRFGGKAATVPAELVSAPCLQPGGKLVVTGSCVVHVADPGSLKMLVLDSATPFTVTARGPGKADFTATDTVEPKDGRAEARVAVDKETDVGVACAGALSCVLWLGDTRGDK